VNEAIRLDPGNAEALHLRGVIEQQTGQAHSAVDVSSQSEGREPAIDNSDAPQTRLQAGYHVMARYGNDSGDADDTLASPFRLTDEGRLEAIEFARRMCRDESRQQRQNLYAAYSTSGEEFDTVVVEFRSLTRQVHLEKALDEDGKPIFE
jgi:hypothetical protein